MPSFVCWAWRDRGEDTGNVKPDPKLPPSGCLAIASPYAPLLTDGN
ncbi:MAG: hypothetical protein AAF215_22555 [Cyanobacteria bacterium P01_A01_bin.123]